jgi:uncharacterized protein (TIGR02996 family)
VFLVAVSPERRWYELPNRGTVLIGSARESDVQLEGHNIVGRHVRLWIGPRIKVEVLRAYGVRVDARLPRGDGFLQRQLEIGPWQLRLDLDAATGLEPIDVAFLSHDDPDARAVYADSLEERGRLAEADLVRDPSLAPTLAARTPPAWRRRFLPIAIENCKRDECTGKWKGPTCAVCKRSVPLFGSLGAAREHAMKGNPVALDPAVRRFHDDLLKPVTRLTREPAIVMGQPVRGR